VPATKMGYNTCGGGSSSSDLCRRAPVAFAALSYLPAGPGAPGRARPQTRRTGQACCALHSDIFGLSVDGGGGGGAPRGARRRGGVGGCVTCLVGRVRIEVRFVYTGYGAGARWWGCARRKWVWHMDADALRKPNGALRRKKATNVSREGQPHAFGVNMQRSAIWR
jgi:hypothetical protein